MRWQYIWKYDAGTSAWEDYTDYQRTDTALPFLDAAGDYWYFGLDRRPAGIYAEMSVNGSYTSLTYYYWANSGAFKKCSLNSTAYSFAANGFQRWLAPADATMCEFTATSPHTGAPPETGVSAYWIRITASTVTTAGTISKLRAIPVSTYASQEDLASVMQLKSGFDTVNPPTQIDIENLLKRKEDRVDYLTRKSWRFNYSSNEEHEFNINGITLLHGPIIDLYSLYIYDGSTWELKVEGRNQDFFTVDGIQSVKFSRFFILPARFAYIPPSLGRWDYGEFAYPVRVTYAWGRDSETDEQFGLAQDTTLKLAAMDIYNAYDRTILSRSGLDKISYDRKVENWRRDIEDQLSELQTARFM